MATPLSFTIPDYAGAADRAVTTGLTTAKTLREGAADWQDYFATKKKEELERARTRDVDLTQQVGLQLPELGAGAAGAFPQDLGQVPQQVVPAQQGGATPQGATPTPTPTPINVDSSGLAGLSGGQLRAALAPIFGQLETQGNLPRGYLDITAAIETGGRFNPDAQNSESSAGGLFQFLDTTAAQYGLTDKFNPVASAVAATRLAQANATSLSRGLGRPPTAQELWLAHNQGAGGAAALLKNPNASALSVLTRVYNGDVNKATAAITGNGGNADMTAGQFAKTVMGYYDSYATSAPQRGASGAVPTYAGVQGQPMKVTTRSGQTVTLPFRAEYLDSEDPARALNWISQSMQRGRYETLPAASPISRAWRTLTGWLGSETDPAEQQLAEQASAADNWARSDEAREWFTRNPNDLVQFAADPVGYFTAYNNAVAIGADTYEQISTSIGETLSTNQPLSQPSGTPAGLQPSAAEPQTPAVTTGLQPSAAEPQTPAVTTGLPPSDVLAQERERVAEMASGVNYELQQVTQQAQAQRAAVQQQYNLGMQRRSDLVAQANNARAVGDTATFNTLREQIAGIDAGIIKLNESLVLNDQELFRPVLRKQLDIAEYALLNAQDPRYLEQLFNSRHSFKIGLRYTNTDASGNDYYLLTSQSGGQPVLVNQTELITKIRGDIDPEYRAGQAATQAAMAVEEQQLLNKLREIAANKAGDAAIKAIEASNEIKTEKLVDPRTGGETLIVYVGTTPYVYEPAQEVDGVLTEPTLRPIRNLAGLNLQR